MDLDMTVQICCMVLSIVGVYLNNKKKTCNFYFFIVTYSVWAVIYFQHGLYPAAMKEIVFIAFNIQGLMMWSRDDRKR